MSEAQVGPSFCGCCGVETPKVFFTYTGEVPETKPTVVFYMGDFGFRRSDYQLKQWVQPLIRLSKICHVSVLVPLSQAGEQFAAANDLNVFMFRSRKHCRAILRDLSPGVILYPNRDAMNSLALGFAQAVHVFVSHGESDKNYMASKAIAVFDVIFVAGEMARRRVTSALPRFPAGRVVAIGRPQLNDVHDVPGGLPFTDRPFTVVYAPTWESGPGKAGKYGSVVSHGEAILRALLDQKAFRVCYRPHPLTGSLNDLWEAENNRLVDIVRRASEAEPGAGHFHDTTDFGWHLTSADAMVSDVSAVAYDWLSTSKPLVVTNPIASASAEVPLVEVVPSVDVTNVHEVGRMLMSQLKTMQRDPHVEQLRNSYFGSTSDSLSAREFFVDHTNLLAGGQASGSQSHLIDISNSLRQRRFRLRGLVRRWLMMVRFLLSRRHG